MLDIKKIRENPEMMKQSLQKRGTSYDESIDKIAEIDKKRRELSSNADSLKNEQNTVSKQIPILKKNGENIDQLMIKMKEISDEIKQYDQQIRQLEEQQQTILLNIPNIPHESVPVGKDDSENVELRKVGNPTTFDFDPLPHWEIGKNLNILDPDTAAKVTGTRFHFYRGLGARLERSIMNFFLDTHTKNGYTEIFTPFIANADSMTATGQIPKFAEDMFKLENLNYYLIPTAEVTVTNMYRNDIIDGNKFPYNYCAYSACFRAEAGAAGRDARGLIRQHQFNKVELVKFADPEDSYQQLEKLTNDAERVLQLLNLPYRVVLLCSGDMGFSSAKTYDIEVWMPSYNKYVEISSCSNFEDFQARRGSIRFKKDVKSKAQLVHTLNGSGIAIGRTVAAILENYQNADGSVRIPEALQSYMGTDKIIQ